MEKIEEEIKDMTPKLIKDLGMKKSIETNKRRYRYGLYECQYCGKEFEALTSNINGGTTRSCGCLRGHNHGLSFNKFYHTWNNIMRRCYNPKNKNYKHYGARGITICEEWLDIKVFVIWAEATYPNIEGYTLDRIDNDKGYYPENCRWANMSIQGTNQRMQKNNTSGITGVCFDSSRGKWVSYICVNNKYKNFGKFNTIEEATLARDNYIIVNNLPHKMSKIV